MNKPIDAEKEIAKKSHENSYDDRCYEKDRCCYEVWTRELSVLIDRHSCLGIKRGDLYGMTLAEMHGLYLRLLRESGSVEQ